MNEQRVTECDEITIEDILSVFPQPLLVSGATLWIRLGGPLGWDSFLEIMRKQPPVKKTRARSGWMCGLALLISKNKTRDQMTDAMKKRAHIYAKYLQDYSTCIMSNEQRVEIVVSKDPAHIYSVQVPSSLATEQLQNWCAAKWPQTGEDIVHGL